MRVQHALAIATNDRSAQIQAKHTSDANRTVANLFDAASIFRLDNTDAQTDADPESSAMSKTWSTQAKQRERPPFETSRQEGAGSGSPAHGISLWA